MRTLLCILPSVGLLLAGCGSNEDKLPEPAEGTVTSTKGCSPSVVHDKEWYTSGKVEPLLPGLGGLHYPITTNGKLHERVRDSVQRYFDQGLVLAYGFNHAEAARSFWEATRLDSTCAMAWWGFAYVLGPNYNMGMEADNYQRADAAISKALALVGSCTAKERGLIGAMALRYAKEPVEDRAPLDRAYSTALRKLTTTYPSDADIATLYAESLMDQHPWDLWEKNGDPKPWTPAIIAALERSMRTFPEHFGAHHLYIHAVEASRTPERGLPSAAFLERAVPGAGHLTHMPSHIYIRTGRYHEGVLVNQHSVMVDSGYTANCHAQGVYPLALFPHNIHFLSACATMSGEKQVAWNSALDLREHLARDLMAQPDWSTLQYYYGFPWMVAVKLELWKELEAEAPPDSAWTYAWGAWHYAQGMRKARTGDTKGARAELVALRKVESDSALKDMRIWGINSGLSVLAVGSSVLEGEILASEGDLAGAESKLRTAVSHEDSLQYQEPPDWSFPSRHELGDVLLRAKKPKEAEAVFQADLINWPENGYALQGLHDALVAQGKDGEAAPLIARVNKAWSHADSKPIAMR